MIGLVGVSSCSPQQPAVTDAQAQTNGRPTAQRPMRIVSLDFCADQFVLKLARRGDIVALSPDATKNFSYMRKEAAGVRTVRPNAEAVLALNPDLVVRSYGGGPNAKAFFEQAGVKVHQITYNDDYEAVRTNVREAATAMGQSEKGLAVVTDFDARLANLKPAQGVSTLYVTPSGITTGPGSSIDLMMTTAGLTNFQTQKGWNALPLERLATARPDMVATAFFDDQTNHKNYWSSARHPIARNMLRQLPVAELDGSTTSCGGWFIMDAIEALAQKGRAVGASKGGKL